MLYTTLPKWCYWFHRLSSGMYLVIFCSHLSCLWFSVIPNCQFRSKTSRLKTFTANQLDEIKDPSGLFYILPFQKVRECQHRQTFNLSRILPLVFWALSFHFRVIWLTGMFRGKCGTTCLERRCLRFMLYFVLLFKMFKKILIWSDFSFLWILYIQVDFADTSIVITEPYFNFSSIQESMNEILFEEYQFQSALRINGSSI